MLQEKRTLNLSRPVLGWISDKNALWCLEHNSINLAVATHLLFLHPFQDDEVRLLCVDGCNQMLESVGARKYGLLRYLDRPTSRCLIFSSQSKNVDNSELLWTVEKITLQAYR